MKKNKKSQLEIMGLVVIVILLTIGMLFMVKFVITRKPSEIKKTYTQTQMASNMLSAILKSTAKDCMNVDMTELLQDCVSGESIICPDGGNSSCDYVMNTIEGMLNSTLGEWKTEYDFRVYWDVDFRTIADNTKNFTVGCKTPERETKHYPIPTDIGSTLIVRLAICG